MDAKYYEASAKRSEENAKRVEGLAQKALKKQQFVRYQSLMEEVGKLSGLAARFREKAQQLRDE